MGIISSIFGERPSAPQTGGFTVGAEIPKELAPYYKDILGKSQALYNESVSQGYQPYTGPSLAEFTPEQQQAFTGISGLQGQQAPIYQEAMGMTRDSAAPITTEQIEEYMNPYQQAVVDVEKREATKQYQSQVVPQLAAKAAMTQPFGGSRQAILEGMAADTQQRLLGDIQAKGSAQAYQDSVNLLNQQRMQQGQAAGQLATMGSNQFKSQLGELGALQTIGEEKQQLSQQALNEAYGQYIKEQEYPYQQLGRYQSVVTGAPIQQTQYVPPTPPGPSVGQQLLGGAATMLGTYGAFGGQMPSLFGTPAAAKTGGGIGDLPVIKRKDKGSVWSTHPEFGYNEWSTKDSATGYEARNKKKDLERAEAEAKRIENLSDGLSFYKNILKNNPRTTTRDLREIQNISNINRYRSPTPNLPNQNTPPVSLNQEKSSFPFASLANEKKQSGGKNSVAQIMKDLEVQDREAAARAQITGTDYEGIVNTDLMTKEELRLYNLQKYKNKINKERESKTIFGKNLDFGSGFYNSRFLDKVENLNIPGRVKSGIETLIAGTEIAKQEVLKPAVEAASEVSDFFGQGEFGIRDKQYPENPGQVFKKVDIDKRITEIKNLPKSIINNAYPALTIKEELTNNPSIIENFLESIGPVTDKGKNLATDSLIKIEALTTKFKNNKDIKNNIKNSKKIIKDNDKKITTTNKENNLSIADLDKRAKIIATNTEKLKEAQAADKPTKKIKTDLDKAQDKYLDALKERNDNLDSKEKLINQSKTESFWAFVARVGANISQGKPIAASVADELPQAMKDRQKLIQAKSDLDDKKDDGLVSLAKAEMTIETADAAAIAAREKEERGYVSKKEIANINARGKTYNMKLPNFENSEPIIDSSFNNISMKLNKEPAIKKYFLANSNIDGINSENFGEVFKQFKNSSDIKNAVYSRAFSDTEPFNPDGSRMTVDQLYRKHFDAQWKEFTGTYRKNNLMGINIPFTAGIKN